MAAFRQKIGDWDRYSAVMGALHAYAHATECLPGADVIAWFAKQHEQALVAALLAAKTAEGGE
jgi:hypothetical protein